MVSKCKTAWLVRMFNKPTIRREGPWLLKADMGDTRVWVNELNKKFQAKRERLHRGHWLLESKLIGLEWRIVE